MKILFLFCSFFLVFACTPKSKVEKPSTKPSDDVKYDDLSSLPQWVLDPQSGLAADQLAGVGSAGPSNAGIRMQIAQAETDARANIAARINTEVSRITKDAMRQAKVDGTNENTDQYFSQATKEVIRELPLSGAKRTNIYRDPKDGTLYVQMVVDQTAVKKYLSDSVSTFSQAAAKTNMSIQAINNVEKNMKSLFDEMKFDKKTDSQDSGDDSTKPLAQMNAAELRTYAMKNNEVNNLAR